MALLRRSLLRLARSSQVAQLVGTMPASSGLVRGFVPGEDPASAVAAAGGLVDDGFRVSIGFLGEEAPDAERADDAVASYLQLLEQLAAAGLARSAEISVRPDVLGRTLPDSGAKLALENTRTLCRAARNAGTTVTLDMEDHTTTDATLAMARELRKDFPETGVALQARLHRTEADCRTLAHEGSRVRLCRGGYAEPTSVAFEDRLDVDRSFVRCLKVLLAGEGYPMIATHDLRLLEIGSALASRYGRAQGSYEFQALYGVRPDHQRRLVDAGETVRVYLPYGSQWPAYLLRRVAARPADLPSFVTSLFSKK